MIVFCRLFDYINDLIRVKKHISKKNRLLLWSYGLAEKRVGIVIDKTLGNQEIVIKSLGKYIGSQNILPVPRLMGDGQVALILDVGSIVNRRRNKRCSSSFQKTKVTEDEKMIGMTSFKLGDEEYGIEIEKVHDIITVPAISPIINSPFSILGMSNLRGKLISVMDLRDRLGLPEQPYQESRVLLW